MHVCVWQFTTNVSKALGSCSRQKTAHRFISEMSCCRRAWTAIPKSGTHLYNPVASCAHFSIYHSIAQSSASLAILDSRAESCFVCLASLHSDENNSTCCTCVCHHSTSCMHLELSYVRLLASDQKDLRSAWRD